MTKVLHVEDSALWRGIVARALEGHDLTSCATLSEAQSAVEQGEFDLIICDGTLGEEDSADRENGLRWAEKLHAQGKKVVVLSGFVKTTIPYLLKGQFENSQLFTLL